MLLDSLQIIKGAVSTKDLIPVFTHVAVHEGLIHGFDGRVHICAPAPELKGYSFTVPMVPFVAAVETCQGKPQIEVKETSLQITAGDFKASMPYGPIESFPMADLQGAKRKVQRLLPVLQALQPFIGIDATRPWSAAIRFQGGMAMATNNVVLVEMAVDPKLPEMTLPAFAVEEILRLGVEPTHVTVAGGCATLYYPGHIWLHTKLMDQPWPNTAAILQGALGGATLQDIPAGLRAAVEQVRPFCPDAKNPLIQFTQPNTVNTLQGAIRGCVGGLSGAPIGTGTYHAEPLLAVLSVARQADWTRFPRVPFTGMAEDSPLSGVLLGIPNL